jgi:hypothetical protein
MRRIYAVCRRTAIAELRLLFPKNGVSGSLPFLPRRLGEFTDSATFQEVRSKSQGPPFTSEGEKRRSILYGRYEMMKRRSIFFASALAATTAALAL